MKNLRRIILLFISAAMICTAAVPAITAEDGNSAILYDEASPKKLSENGDLVYASSPTASEVMMNFRNKGELTLLSLDGKRLALEDKVGSGARVVSADEKSAVEVVIPGDVNGDAAVSSRDAAELIRYLAGYDLKISAKGADISREGRINAKDAAMILQRLAGWKVGLYSETEELPVAANDDPDVDLVFDTVLHRATRENANPSRKKTYTAMLARDETEDVQLFFISDRDIDSCTLEVSDAVNADGVVLSSTLRYVYYFAGGNYRDGVNGEPGVSIPDPIPVYYGEEFKLNAGESKGFVLQLRSTRETPSGYYTATVTLKNAAGEEIKKGLVRAYVWDFALDERTWAETAVGYNVPDSHYARDYETLTNEYRISPYGLPYDIMDSRADAYMSNPRVSTFSVTISGYGGRYSRNNAEILQCYDKIATNGEWLRKAYLYPVDEPWKQEHFDALESFYNWISSERPQMDWELVVPVSNNPYDPQTQTDRMSQVIPYCTILCPQIYAYRDYANYAQIKADPDYYQNWDFYLQWTDSRIYSKYGNWTDRANKLVEEGYRAWWYSCDAPGMGPMCDFYMRFQGARHRLFFWQQYFNDIDGFLYWAINHMVNDEGKRVTATKTNFGDGLWVYTDADFLSGQTFVPSLRLESIRDGIEDFNLFTQLENLTGDREESMGYVKQIITNINVYDENNDNIEKTRQKLCFYLESLYTGK